IVFVSVLAMALPFGGALMPVLGYGLSGIGMGIASPALFGGVLKEGEPRPALCGAVLNGGERGREGRSPSSVPLSRQVGAGLGTAIAGIVFAISLSDGAIRASERDRAHVAAVVH